MKYARLGSTGLKVSRMCMGTMTFGNQVDLPGAHAILDTAAEGGVNFIDVADVYPMGSKYDQKGETERIVGKWLQGKRDKFILATKCASPMGKLAWEGGTSRKHILDAIDASLKRLNVDYVDLYQLHRDDPDTTLDETLEALDIVVKSGRARYVGVSNWMAWRIARALGRSEALHVTKFSTVQPRYNLIYRQFERDIFPMCIENGLGTMCYNPIAAGLLTGKHKDMATPAEGSRFSEGGVGTMYKDRYWHEREFDAVRQLAKIADEAGMPLMHMALAWVLAQPGVTCALIGASRASQLADSFASNNVTLGPDLLATLDKATREFRMGDSTR